MKILIFWEQVEWGGVDTHLLELIKNWPNKNDTFTILTNKNNEGLKRIKEEIVKCNVKINYFRIFSYSSLVGYFINKKSYLIFWAILNVLKPPLFFISKYQLKKILFNYTNYDVLLADNGGYPASWGCLAALVSAKELGFKKKILLIHHASAKISVPLSYFENFIDKKVKKSIDKIIFVSVASMNTFFKRRKAFLKFSKTEVIPNEFKYIETQDNSDLKAYFESLRDYKSQKLVGMIGRIDSYKGQEDLLHAIKYLPKDYINKFKFLIIGRGTKKSEKNIYRLIKKYTLSKNVTLLGYLNHQSINIIKNLDLSLMLTRDFEGFGLTILESIHAGVPFIATDVGAVSEFISNDLGELIAPNSPESISASLKNFLENPVKWKKRADNTKNLFRLKNIRMHENYYKSMIEK